MLVRRGSARFNPDRDHGRNWNGGLARSGSGVWMGRRYPRVQGHHLGRGCRYHAQVGRSLSGQIFWIVNHPTPNETLNHKGFKQYSGNYCKCVTYPACLSRPSSSPLASSSSPTTRPTWTPSSSPSLRWPSARCPPPPSSSPPTPRTGLAPQTNC